MTKSAAELQHEAQLHRDALSSTLDQLGNSLTTDHLAAEMMSLLKDSSASIVRSLASQARANPVPALLIGVGLTMLLTRDPSKPGSDLISKAGHMMKDALAGGVSAVGAAASSVGLKAHEMGDKARHAVDEARGAVAHAGEAAMAREHALADKATGLKERVVHAAGERIDSARAAIHDGQDRARHLADEAQRLAHHGKDSLQQLAHEQPILLAAAGAALGAVLGALFPVTEQERRYLGRMSAEATKAGRETVAKVADVVKSEALGDHPETKVAAVAERVVRTVTKNIENPIA